MNNLWKPDRETALALSRFKKKKPSKSQKRENKLKHEKKIREDLIKFFGLNKYATNVAICFCIHNQHGAKMPEKDSQIKGLMKAFHKHVKGRKNPRFLLDDDFYKTKKWRELRYIALQQSDGTCTLCGAKSSDGVQLHVDHIVPRSRNPHKQYDLNNLQVLCEDCNLGKSNYDDTDWRALG